MNAARAVSFNGKFLSGGRTAVHDTSKELIAGFSRLLQNDQRARELITAEILCPPGVRPPVDLCPMPYRRAGLSTWQVWEQVDLPMAARSSLLVSLSNLAPVSKTNAITMIHDAQPFSTPESYSIKEALLYKTLMPIIGRNHKRILTVSNYSKNSLDRYQVAPASKIAVIYNGVDHILKLKPDIEILAKHGLSADEYVLGLANSQSHKNIHFLIDLFSHEALKTKTLVLYGKAKPEDFRAKGADIPDNVIFTGFVSDEERRALMENAGLMAFPSLTEGFGLPPLEAMRVGTPALCSPFGALPEICGDAAQYADPSEPESWIRHILLLLSESSEERDNRVQACIAQASQYAWDKSARRLLDEISNVLVEQSCTQSVHAGSDFKTLRAVDFVSDRFAASSKISSLSNVSADDEERISLDNVR